MVINVKPIGDRVIVKNDTAEAMRPSGIFIPETVREKPNHGTVMAHGNGTVDFPITVKVGDKIIFHKGSGTEIIIEGDSYLIMRESDIYAVL